MLSHVRKSSDISIRYQDMYSNHHKGHASETVLCGSHMFALALSVLDVRGYGERVQAMNRPWFAGQ